MNYYIERNGIIILVDTDKQRLSDTLPFIPDSEGLEIQETAREILNRNGVYVFADEVADVLFSEAKAAKLAQNKEAYEAALKSGVTYKNTLFDCDTLAAVRLMGQMVATQSSAIAAEDTIDWFDYNYIPVTLTIPEFMELAGLVTLNTRRIETLNCGYNTAIEAAQTTAELAAIEISYSEAEVTDEV